MDSNGDDDENDKVMKIDDSGDVDNKSDDNLCAYFLNQLICAQIYPRMSSLLDQR